MLGHILYNISVNWLWSGRNVWICITSYFIFDFFYCKAFVKYFFRNTTKLLDTVDLQDLIYETKALVSSSALWFQLILPQYLCNVFKAIVCSFDHCTVCPSSYSFWLSFWYLQTFRMREYKVFRVIYCPPHISRKRNYHKCKVIGHVFVC